jgi:hypothetical protein
MTHVTATLVTRSVTGFAVAFTASDIGWQAARSWGHVTGFTVNPFVVFLAGAVLMAAFMDAALHVPDEAIDTLAAEAREALALAAGIVRWIWHTGRRCRPRGKGRRGVRRARRTAA